MNTTQSERIKSLLVSRSGQWVPLPEILDLHIAQYNRAINDIRKVEGFDAVQNRIERVNGVVHSWFRYNPTKQGMLAI